MIPASLVGENMRYQLLTVVTAAAALLGSSPALASPASRNSATKNAALTWELGFLGLSAVDTAETLSCVHRDTCHELNPLFGRHPSTMKLVAAKVGLGLIHFAAFKYINDRDPKMALRAAEISAGFQGGVVLLNAKFGF